MTTKREIIVALASLAAIFFLFEFTNIDIFVQNYFYDEVTQKWLLLHQKGTLLDMLFYTGIKKAIIIFGVFILSLYLYSFKDSAQRLKEYRSGLLIVWLSIAMVPLIVGAIKAVSNVPCPYDCKYFGGEYPYIRVFDSMPQEIVKKFKCYPAGHASGGFALMSLFFLFKERKNRFIALGVAVLIGWSMGLYKMLIGHHYLGHTVITMILAWFLILVIYKIVK
ncbi:phosphatase PAP2 family protein [Sulfurimonas xiamenensis]|uniref:Phosphatase PAP2 family protein n=1 Tax=Sulfurimonas xiamenensis TaxID=2590021 RepID=A0AAJ4DM28_9BACT|nr:phosphatase PAP2 family protein [Sulfurimonas xiamenensis]QFR42610.1 phosphatase PAP2 family protein [Sulfurimonas xiamenensis]